jgi:hypothetical protein
MKLTDEQIHAISHAQKVLRGVKLYDLAALLSASKPAVPEGWKLVPVEPTDLRMFTARVKEIVNQNSRSVEWIHIDDVKQLCRDFSSRTGSVYIKDVESALDAIAHSAPSTSD